MAPGVKSDTSKRLGALLLQGWAMLAENCPDCKVPLMKERTSDERLCVNCDTTFVPDVQGLRPTNRPAQNQAATEEPAQLAQQPEQDSIERNDGGAGDAASSDSDPRADPRLGPFASSAVSERRADGVPSEDGDERGSRAGKPLMGSSASTQGPSGAARAGGPPSSTIVAGAPSSASRSASASADPVEDIADLLSAKMLQGWALLDKYCPRCNTVLVRSKATKRMFCVSCDSWVLTEADTQLQKEQQQQQQEEKQKQKPPALAHKPQQPEQPQEGVPSTNAEPWTDTQAPTQVAGRPSLDAPQQQLPAAALPRQQEQLQLPLLYQQFFTPVASTAAGEGAGGCSRGSSPPQRWPGGALSGDHQGSAGAPSQHQQQEQQQQQQQQHPRPARQVSSSEHGQAHGSSGTGAGPSSSSKQPNGTALLLSIGRTVALKMAETQGLLERTPALDTERARSYVALISECLDLLSKLHGLHH